MKTATQAPGIPTPARPCPAGKALLLAVVATLSTLYSQADNLRLPGPFSDHMVIQRSRKTPVWGWAEPGQRVSVTMGNTAVTTTTGPDGRWTAWLDLSQADSSPQEMRVEAEGGPSVTVKDVLIGEVWLASGQSNMAFELERSDITPGEISASTNPHLREFHVRNSLQPTPGEDCHGSWVVASPASVGKFSAVGWYFGQALERGLKTPVGIINASVGGTPIEAWLSTETMSADPVLAEGSQRAINAYTHTDQLVSDFATEYGAWLRANQRECPAPTELERFATPPAASASAPAWADVNVPGFRFPAAGVGWLRKEVTLTPENAGKPWPIAIQTGYGYQELYWDGEKVGETSFRDKPGIPIHTIPARLMSAGQHTLALRIYCPVYPAMIHQISDRMRIGEDPHNFIGQWQFAEELRYPTLPEAVLAEAPKPLKPLLPNNAPGVLYNTFIAPLIPYGIRGIIWYQGESNLSRAAEYTHAFQLLISDWRERWGQDELAFYFCQLAAFSKKTTTPGNSQWAELREAQAAALALPETGMAVLSDAGEASDIHPRNKRVAGERLAALALSNTYGQGTVSQGPQFESAVLEGNSIRVKFSHTGDGLVAYPLAATYPVRTLKNESLPLILNSPGSELEGFAVCGADGQWSWAQARIDGDSVVVWSDTVEAPQHVRYSWADNPSGNLYNAEGFPAIAFRTDTQGRISEETRYGFDGQR
ncbi:acetyl esterase [Ruficoccus amylovorans]|uniref:Acetyl esterase n=1 Tax=Ruficoccus amylovorans TaxID=1804625 RepID=A0A842HK07_9BACT|nr:sialate O-acetylesterase [Ruficoccus amylovorans]MBC2595994.1 acetyl esterase [Ruficoccus amylovorans]